MRIVDIREISVPISRYADPTVPSGGLNTSVVAVITDVVRDAKPIVGYGFASIGRFAQGGLIRERFAPRLLAASDADLTDQAGTNLDPFRAWKVMMANEKPGGHGERCVAVGALDMALWDAVGKIARLPLYRLLMERTGATQRDGPCTVSVYAGGGYYYPTDDIACLSDEVRRFRDLGYGRTKIKIGSAPLARDLKRIDAAARLLDGPGNVAVDAIYAYTAATSPEAADALAPRGLWWFEDICDPLDFETVATVARRYAAQSPRAKRSSPRPKPICLTGTADCAATGISWFLILSIATAYRDICRSSSCLKSAAGRAGPFGHTVGISSAYMS